MKKPVGQTKDVGFQFGIRRTFPLSPQEAWEYLFSQKGLNKWLGKLETAFELKEAFRTQESITGFVRIFKPHSHIRLEWKLPEWKNTSTLQIRVIENKGKATISFHQEKLLDSKQREEMKAHWSQIMNEISTEIREANP